MEEKTMLMIVFSNLCGVLFGFVLNWICASNKIDAMKERIAILENHNKRLYKDLAEFIVAGIKKELRDE